GTAASLSRRRADGTGYGGARRERLRADRDARARGAGPRTALGGRPARVASAHPRRPRPRRNVRPRRAVGGGPALGTRFESPKVYQFRLSTRSQLRGDKPDQVEADDSGRVRFHAVKTEDPATEPDIA